VTRKGVEARSKVLTPPMTLSALTCESGALYYIHQRNLCGNPFKPPEKAISRGDRL
jgi:hypothetical protein